MLNVLFPHARTRMQARSCLHVYVYMRKTNKLLALPWASEYPSHFLQPALDQQSVRTSKTYKLLALPWASECPPYCLQPALWDK